MPRDDVEVTGIAVQELGPHFCIFQFMYLSTEIIVETLTSEKPHTTVFEGRDSPETPTAFLAPI